MRSILALFCFIIINTAIMAQEPDLSIPVSSAEKYNKRGFYKNENISLNGNEIISDYDGNVMLNYSSPINLPADLSGDFSITYNANVDHRIFDGDDVIGQGNMINAPEWILGFKGFALQTLNFETNFFTRHENPNNYHSVLNGEEIALLIPGYHYGNSLGNISNDHNYDFMNILKADGSKIVLQNVKENAKTGLYKELGYKAKGFAIVEYYTNPEAPQCTSYRKIWYKPGDGFTYVFEEKKVTYLGTDTIYTCYDKSPRVLYLSEIYSPGSYLYSQHLQFFYTDTIPNAVINYGRKAFIGMQVTHATNDVGNFGSQAVNYKGTNSPELDVVYGYSGNSLLNIRINNYNTNKNLILNISAPNRSSTSLFSTARDTGSVRKLNVTSIKDDLGRTDNFTYYNWYNNVCGRTYVNNEVNKFFLFKFPLLNSVNYYTGKSSVFTYYDKTFTSSDQKTFFDFNGIPYILENHDFAYRDCFTNFMLKSHEIWNKYNSTNTIAKKDEYSYNFDHTSNGKLRVEGIKTEIVEYDGTSPEGTSIIRTQTKNYSKYRTNQSAFNASDFEYTIQLMSEKIVEFTGAGSIEKIYTYDVGNPDGSNDPCYTGNFDMRAIKEIKRGTSPDEYLEKIDSVSNTYDNYCITYNRDSKFVSQIKKSETRKDPNSLIHFTEYLNSYPVDSLKNYTTNWKWPYNGDYYDNNVYLYSIGLPKEEKIFHSGEVSSDIIKEYYERGNFANKLRKVTNKTNANRSSYNTYSYWTGPSYMSLPFAIENDKGVRQEFYYPNAGTFQEAIPGIIVKHDQSRIQSTFYHCGYQIQPFKTLTIYTNPSGIRDTLINYSSYNPDGTLQFAVDENGLHSAFAYDKAGRLISAALPGSFQDGKTSFVPQTSMRASNEFTKFISNRAPSSTGTSTKPFSISVQRYTKTTINELWEDETGYYAFFGNDGYQGNKGILKVDLNLLTDKPAGLPRTVTISGIYQPYQEGREYYPSGLVTLTIPNSVPLGSTVNLEIDIASLLPTSGTSRLYGFEVKAVRTNDDEDYCWALQMESSPELTVYYNSPGATPGDPIDKQTNITGTVVYNYDDVKNVVTQRRRLNSDPLNFKEVVTKELLDGLGQVRADSIETDLKVNNRFVYELKDTNTYNSDGKVLTHTDGEGRKVTNSYDFLQRLLRQTNGDNTYKTTEYYSKPKTLYGRYETNYSEYSVTIDEQRDANRTVYTYYDNVGNKIAEKTGANYPTIFQYDKFYRLYKVISPAGNIRTYSYDELGNLKQKDSPAEEGTTLYKYDKYKRLRFTMNSAAPAYERGITFTKYDQFGRVLATGTLSSTYGWSLLDADKDYSVNQNLPHFESYQADTANFVCVNMYDKYMKSGIFARMADPFSWLPADANSSRNVKGKLVLTAFRDKPGQGWNYRIYLYDHLGNVNYIYQKFSTAPWKLIFKETDILGNQKRENIYKVEGGSLVYEQATWNNYDKQGRLVDVRTDPVGNYSSAKVEATYTYNKADQCSTLTYNQVTNANKTTTYTYSTTRGWLNSIVNGSGNFSESLGYYDDGNIQTQTLTNSALGGTKDITYGYDVKDRLVVVLGMARETFQYDDDGNITLRGYFSGENLNNLNLKYSGNRLDTLITNTNKYGYGYDNRGNITSDQFNGITSITYDHRNLPLSITKSSSTSKYRYDDGGNRIFKDAQGNKEYYFRDDKGHEVAVYDISTDKPKMINLYGSELIGRIDLSWTSQYDYEFEQYVWSRSDSRKYYVKDHLGSIRQTLSESGVVMSAMDYYAFGGTMSSYVNGNTIDKYKFTGKERDSETGLDYFGARYYDSKIGRWMSVDPLASKYPGWSPYNYCLNNPIRYFDPEGMDVWEKVRNFINGKGWRDDNLQENYQQRDWENLTPQLAKEQNVPDGVVVQYSPEEKLPSTGRPGHDTGVADDGKTKVITMTKGGYEQFDESNLNNMRNSMVHEIDHSKKSAATILKGSVNDGVGAKVEFDAIKAQRNDPTWKNTSGTYKIKIRDYENGNKEREKNWNK